MACQLKDAKTDDYKVVDILTEGLTVKLAGDKGYLKNNY